MKRFSVRTRISLAAGLLSCLALIVISVVIVRMVEGDVRVSAERALSDALQTEANQRLGQSATQQTAFDLTVDGQHYELGIFDELSGGNAGGDLFIDGEPFALLELDLRTNRVVSVSDPTSGLPISDEAVVDELQALTFDVLDIDGGQVLVGASAMEEIDAATAAIRRALAIVVPLLVVLTVAGAWMVAGRTLRPVRHMAAQAATISSTSLGRRVPVAPGRDEVAELGLVVNAMLDRLEVSDRRQREFSGDASHELRSPLTTIRAAAEAIAERPDAEKTESRAESIVAEADRMEGLIADLLALARAELPRPSDSVDLVDLVRDIAPDRFEGDSAQSAVVPGDAGQLRRAIENLLDNAYRYGDGTVVVGVHQENDQIRLTVENDGPPVPEDQLDRIFERFARIDDARSRGTGGAGIGLALVKAIALRHGATLAADQSPTLGGARFTLTFACPNRCLGSAHRTFW